MRVNDLTIQALATDFSIRQPISRDGLLAGIDRGIVPGLKDLSINEINLRLDELETRGIIDQLYDGGIVISGFARQDLVDHLAELGMDTDTINDDIQALLDPDQGILEECDQGQGLRFNDSMILTALREGPAIDVEYVVRFVKMLNTGGGVKVQQPIHL